MLFFFPKCTFLGPQLSRRGLVWYLLKSWKARAGLIKWPLVKIYNFAIAVRPSRLQFKFICSIYKHHILPLDDNILSSLLLRGLGDCKPDHAGDDDSLHCGHGQSSLNSLRHNYQHLAHLRPTHFIQQCYYLNYEQNELAEPFEPFDQLCVLQLKIKRKHISASSINITLTTKEFQDQS